MATNCLAPAYLKLFYESNGHDHVMTLPVKNSGSGANFELERYDNSTIAQATGVTELMDVLLPLFDDSSSFSGWEAYLQADCESSPTFANAGTLMAADGTNVGAAAAWVQAVLTYKSSAGGRGKFQMMEGVFGINTHTAISGLSGIVKDLSDYLISSDSWIYARDNGKLTLPLFYTTKVNDVLRKRELL